MSKRLIIQIPCLNEAQTLPLTLQDIPKTIKGIDTIELLIINDGSSDNTVEVAKKYGVNHVINFNINQGLAKAFMAGLLESAKLGADFLVNLDADNQYNADDIQSLLTPLLEQKADIVVGERPIRDIQSFSWLKKKLQVLGSWIIRKLSKTDIQDIPSGFRAYNRKAMLSLHIFNQFTYTHESVIAASELGLRIIGVPIRVNHVTLRSSRLMKSMFQYIIKSAGVTMRFFLIYNPYPVLLSVSLITGLCGLILVVRFLVYYIQGYGSGWIQSLIIASIFITISIISFMIAIVSDLLKINRKLLEKILFEMREVNYKKTD